MFLSKEAEQYINNEVAAHYDAVVEYMGSKDAVLGVFAYGSMNYGTFEFGKSDVDTKAIIIPTFDNCIFDKPISKELHINDTHCEVKDIRLMVDCYKKQNLNFIETLFTPYYKINPIYEYLWQYYFANNAERIAHYNEDKCIQSTVGQAIHTFHQIKDWDGKKYANLLRSLNFLQCYCYERLPYMECITPYELNKIKKIKYSKEPCLTQEEINNIISALYSYQNREQDKYRFVCRNIDYELDKIFYKAIKSLILARINN